MRVCTACYGCCKSVRPHEERRDAMQPDREAKQTEALTTNFFWSSQWDDRPAARRMEEWMEGGRDGLLRSY